MKNKKAKQLAFKGISLLSKFTAHGFYTATNAGGFEIMISRDGESARVRDAYGDRPVSKRYKYTSGWKKIEYSMTDDEGVAAVIDPDGYNIPMDLVMRTSFAQPF